METSAHTPFYADKSFWLVVLGIVLPPLGKKFGIAFDAVEMAGMVTLIVGFVTGSKWKQATVIKAEAAGKAAAASVVTTDDALRAMVAAPK